MKYILLIYGAETKWTQASREACMVESQKVCEKLKSEGKLLDASPLQSVTNATCLRIRQGKTEITDGPFAETTEQLGGYYLLDVEHLDEALEIASKLPPASVGTVEIRPLDTLPGDPASPRQGLAFSRLVPARPEVLYRAWTEPELLQRWFTPKPWQTVEAELDPRPGGAFCTVFQGPNGERMENKGVYLELVRNRKVVFTDAFAPGWKPKESFMVATVTFEPEGRQTRYTAKAEHWTDEAEAKHQAMGFEDGWNRALDQLLELADELMANKG